MKQPYYITYYCGFPKTDNDEARYQEAIDCGFNLLQIEHGTVEEKQAALRFCEKKGVRATVHDNRITELVYNNWEKRLDDPKALEAVIRGVCEDYKDYPALLSYNIIDEPSTDKYPLLGAIVALFRKYDPAHFCYINLNPGQKQQEEYMDVVKPAMLSFDRYHLMRKETSEKNGPITDPETAKAHAAAQTKFDNPGWYKNLEEVRQLALRYGIPYMIIILLTEHGQYRYLTREEISYEAWQTLAYGSAVLSYFRYWNGPVIPTDTFWRDQNSCIQGEGDDLVICQHYYDVQAVNAAIRPIGERIAQTVSEAVFHVGEEADPVRPFEGYGPVRAIAGGRYTVGFFADGSFVIANKDYEASSLCALDTDAKLEVFDAEMDAFVPAAEKRFVLPAGGGIYLRTR